MRVDRFSMALLITALTTPPAVTLVAAAPGSATASVDAASGVCPALAGSTWQLPYSPYTKGNEYDVHVRNVSCVKADKYIKKLVTKKVGHGLTPSVKGGPPGWTCTGSRSKTGLAYTGQCSKSSSFSGPFFGWSVG
jgi:hypothetical protein